MTCQHVRDRLALWATGDVSESERARIDAHLVSCAACRELAEAYRTAVAEVRGADRAQRDPHGPVVVRAEAVRRIRAACAAAIRAERRRGRLRRGVRTAIALAATVVFGVLVGYLVHAFGRGETGLDPALERWRYEGAQAERTSSADGVIVRRDRLYVVRRSQRDPNGSGPGGAVVAIDARLGQVLWKTPLAAPGYLAADGERVYCVASAQGGGLDLVALTAGAGRTAWRFGYRSGRVVLHPSRPAPLAGNRVAWTVGSTLHLLDARTGRALWTRTLPDEGLLSRAAVAGEDLLVAGCRGLYGIEAASGRERWHKAFRDDLAPALPPLLAVAGDRTYVAGAGPGRTGRLMCLDRHTGRCLWRRGVPLPRHLLADGDRVYVRGPDVLALDESSGEAVWTCRADGCGPLTCEDGLIRFVDSGRDGRLVALYGRTGRTAWEIPGLKSCGAFLTVGDTGYVKTWDGVVHAIALRTP